MNAQLTLLLSTTLLSTSLAQEFWKDSFRLNFNYDLDSQRGPSDWEEVNVDDTEYEQYARFHPIFDLDIDVNECGRRVRPSPIALERNSDCTDDHEILTRKIQDDDCTRDNLTFELTPHTLRAYFPDDDDNCERPTIEMDGIDDDPFILVWMEVHARSEHVIAGRRFDAELQMVHMGTDNSDDEMATVSIMIDATAKEDHTEFQFMLEGWQRAAASQDRRCEDDNRSLRSRKQVNENAYREKLKNNGKKKSSSATQTGKDSHQRQTQQCGANNPNNPNCGPRRKMYPYSMWPSIYYYRYAGSLTTPPCSAVVNWRVLDKTMQITRRQYKQMVSLMGTYKDGDCDDESAVSDRGENFRPLQRMNEDNQNVAHCTAAHFSPRLYGPNNQ